MGKSSSEGKCKDLVRSGGNRILTKSEYETALTAEPQCRILSIDNRLAKSMWSRSSKTRREERLTSPGAEPWREGRG